MSAGCHVRAPAWASSSTVPRPRSPAQSEPIAAMIPASRRLRRPAAGCPLTAADRPQNSPTLPRTPDAGYRTARNVARSPVTAVKRPLHGTYWVAYHAAAEARLVGGAHPDTISDVSHSRAERPAGAWRGSAVSNAAARVVSLPAACRDLADRERGIGQRPPASRGLLVPRVPVLITCELPDGLPAAPK